MFDQVEMVIELESAINEYLSERSTAPLIPGGG